MAFAQPSEPHADFSELRRTNTQKVRNVIDPLTLVLKDNKTIRLAGIDIPDFDVHDPGEVAASAAKILKKELEEKDINIYQTTNNDLGRTNRMGHEIAHLELKNTKIWVQGLLLQQGLARVRTTRRNPEMAEQMYALEEKARSEEKGIWGLTGFPVLNLDTAEQGVGTFQIVEGKVHAIATVKNTIYLNFGPDWRTDFTVSIKSGDLRQFSAIGLDRMSWRGKTIRSRGWLRSWNGPYMEIDHPQAIQILD